MFEDKFAFFRKTLRGEAVASQVDMSRGERSNAMLSRKSGSSEHSPVSLSPRMGRGAIFAFPFHSHL